ncbi:MAG: hypothetical protein LBG52_05850 [Candidatus Peribacteria bacterium]|jgi:hypothetical protein|nr:hypothetical protein [Candidatus Peribacteria bacterium]
MKLSFQKLESEPKKGNIMSFSTEILSSVSHKHFITINRPLLDEESIERMIRSNYAEQIAK